MGINLNEYIGVLSVDTQAVDEARYQRELFEEYVLRRPEQWTEERWRLQREYKTGLTPLTGKDGLRRQLGAIDLAYFGRAYLPHYFIRKSPRFHEELDDIWTDGVLKGCSALTSAETINRKPAASAQSPRPEGTPNPRRLPSRTTFTRSFTNTSITS